MKAELYRQIPVWRRISETEAIRYMCLESLCTSLFYVQSSDFVRLPLDEDLMRQHERHFSELFIETDIAVRVGGHNTLRAAIEQHDADFSD